jgi:hypothetical protein
MLWASYRASKLEGERCEGRGWPRQGEKWKVVGSASREVVPRGGRRVICDLELMVYHRVEVGGGGLLRGGWRGRSIKKFCSTVVYQ